MNIHEAFKKKARTNPGLRISRDGVMFVESSEQMRSEFEDDRLIDPACHFSIQDIASTPWRTV